MSSTGPYLLGISEDELERMRFQHGVWRHVTDEFLDKLGIAPGWRCLDVGAGPGFVTMDLRERVGDTGSVTALDPSALYLDHVRALIQEKGWTNIATVQSDLENALIAELSFDLAYVRWVVDFVPDRVRFLKTLARKVRSGGIIAVEDYFYEGLAVHPRGTDFDRMPDIVRRYYRSGGGDPYAIADVPELLRSEGFGLVLFAPQQQVGGKDSPVFQWASTFFRIHVPIMADRGVIDATERDRQLQNLDRLGNDPTMMFFSPIVVQCAMRKR